MSLVSRSVGRPVSRSVLAGQLNTLASLIKTIFANSEQGFAYDINDLSTLYQDAAGTIPVTAAGQPVGLVLDKSKGLSAEILINNDFNSTSNWALPSGITISGGKLNINASVGGVVTQILGSQKPSGWYEARLKVDSLSGSNYTVRLLDAASTIVGNAPYKNATGDIVWKIYASAPFARVIIQCGGGAGLTAVIDSISVKEIAGNHSYQTVSASRPILQRNATTGAYYLAFDGVDDFLQTNTIDFTTTSKISLFAGMRKLSDAAIGTLVEFSSNKNVNNGVFAVFAPLDVGISQAAWCTKGTTERAVANNSLIAPTSLVISAKGSVSESISTFKVNGGQISNNGSQGTGNYGNYPLFIGRRAGTSLPFNGHIYSLIGIGRLTTDSETLALEKVIAKNTGVTLSV